jgi:excisionase family DNA binding protein
MRLMTTEELAVQMGVSTRRVTQLATEGRIHPSRKIGRSWSFTSTSIVIPPFERPGRYNPVVGSNRDLSRRAYLDSLLDSTATD